MVDIDQIKNILHQLEKFFHCVIEESKNEADIDSASYGLSKVESIKSILDKYAKEPQNRLLKQIDAGFISVTRGVEYFNDYETNRAFYKLCDDIPSLKPYIK